MKIIIDLLMVCTGSIVLSFSKLQTSKRKHFEMQKNFISIDEMGK